MTAMTGMTGMTEEAEMSATITRRNAHDLA
jgi:hypothetical protein